MMRRFLSPLARFHGLLRGAAIATLGLAVLALPGRAEAGIRLTLSAPGSATQFFTSNTDAVAAVTTIDGYTLVITSALTNFSTDPNPTGGTLSTNVQYSTGSGPIAPLTVTSEVINGGAVGSPLAIFTGPSSPNSLVTVDVTGNGSSGTVTGTTIVNGSPQTVAGAPVTSVGGTQVTVGPIPIAGLVETVNSATANTTGGYTLQDRLVISGVSPNSTSQSVSVRGTVATAVPEPATVAMVLSALPLMGLGVLRRRRLAK